MVSGPSIYKSTDKICTRKLGSECLTNRFVGRTYGATCSSLSYTRSRKVGIVPVKELEISDFPVNPHGPLFTFPTDVEGLEVSILHTIPNPTSYHRDNIVKER